MKVEIDLTKSDVDKLRRLIGLQTKTRAEVVLKSFDINELNKEEINELIKDIMEQNKTEASN